MTILRKTPKQLLTESLKELASKNTINKICVTDIARNCSMSNSNFYHHFADKYELIAYIMNNEIDEKIGYEAMNLQTFVEQMLDILEADNAFYSNVLSNTLFEYPNHAFFHETLDPKIKDLIVTNCIVMSLDNKTDLLLHVYLAGITAAMCSHVINHRRSREDLMDAFMIAIPDKLLPYVRTENVPAQEFLV